MKNKKCYMINKWNNITNYNKNINSNKMNNSDNNKNINANKMNIINNNQN